MGQAGWDTQVVLFCPVPAALTWNKTESGAHPLGRAVLSCRLGMASTKGLPLSWAEQKPNPVGFSPRKPSLVCGQDRQAGSLPGEGTGWCWWLQEPQPRFPCGFRALSCCQPWPVALKPQMALAPGSYCPLTVAPWGATVVGDIDRCRRGASVKATVSAAWAPAPQPGHQHRSLGTSPVG